MENSFKRQLYDLTDNPLKMFSIVFIIISCSIWYAIFLTLISELVKTYFDAESASLVDKITNPFTQTILIGIPTWVLIKAQNKTLWFVTLIVGFFNILMYITNPTMLFKWIGYGTKNK